jgi:hypothetical protein
VSVGAHLIGLVHAVDANIGIFVLISPEMDVSLIPKTSLMNYHDWYLARIGSAVPCVVRSLDADKNRCILAVDSRSNVQLDTAAHTDDESMPTQSVTSKNKKRKKRDSQQTDEAKTVVELKKRKKNLEQSDDMLTLIEDVKVC